MNIPTHRDLVRVGEGTREVDGVSVRWRLDMTTCTECAGVIPVVSIYDKLSGWGIKGSDFSWTWEGDRALTLCWACVSDRRRRLLQADPPGREPEFSGTPRAYGSRTLDTEPAPGLPGYLVRITSGGNLSCDYSGCFEPDYQDIIDGTSHELRPMYLDTRDDVMICQSCVDEGKHLDSGGLTMMAIEKATFDLLPSIFADCVDDEDCRYALSAPFDGGDGWIYATDGRICARVPATPERAARYAQDPTKRYPVVGGCFLPLPDDAPDAPLPECGRLVECRSCHGRRTWTCDCPDCCESHDCESCDGTGKALNFAAVKVGPVLLAAHFVAALRDAGVASVRVGMTSRVGNPCPAAYFEGDGFEGLVMPMTVGED